MRLESRTWYAVSLVCLAGAAFFWWRGNQEVARQRAAEGARGGSASHASNPAATPTPYPLLSNPAALPAAPSPATGQHLRGPAPSPGGAAAGAPGAFPHRLYNSARPLAELWRSDQVILLENAFIDTSSSAPLPIPDHLRAGDDPGAYLVQAQAPLDAAFYARLQRVPADFVAYVPHQAALVRATAEGARRLAAQPEVRAVLPYEPYFKFARRLLPMAVRNEPLPADALLDVVLFADLRESARTALQRLGADLIGETATPFGPQVTLRPAAAGWTRLAQLPGVQRIEPTGTRGLLNDLSRVRVKVSADTVTPDSYLGLTGTNITVNLNDTGVDASHPDLQDRVFSTDTNAFTLLDWDGHGTHVAGTIASSGAQSGTVTNASGSLTNASYRGLAPAAELFVLPIDLRTGPLISDRYLQTTAATQHYLVRGQTNGLLSNNSWSYHGTAEYNLAAASYDAAVRDALPDVPGPQPVLYVFGAGNAGQGLDDGTGGDPDSIEAPGTAKNVITVGALESDRSLTNVDWAGLTDSANEVASFSSRGNVAIGTEGDFGRFKPDLVAPGVCLISTRSTNAFWVDPTLSELGPYYRYESGTSMAAPVVSGMLALLQEFFESQLQRRYSPALLKALLINGARSVNPDKYDLRAAKAINFQGWGLANLTNSLPGSLTNTTETADWPLRFYDDPAGEVLATGQTHTWNVALTDEARVLPLRVSLVWTDPPGNPGAAIKLVNDLDLVVTNLDTGEIFWGNHIPQNAEFNAASDPDATADRDIINNVENVFLEARFERPLATNYSISVLGRRVNVNTVTANTNDVVQDYALVIASGNGQLAAPFRQVTRQVLAAPVTPLIALTNGVPLLDQRVGANFQLVVSTNGVTNQWRFYAFTNYSFTNYTSLTNGSNIAFVTFLPPNLARPRNRDADLDLYVSRDGRLTNLEPSVLAASEQSTSRGGTEVVLFTNAVVSTDEVFYIGVKSEDQQAGEFGIVALSTDQFFDQTDAYGNRILQGMPAGVPVPDGSPPQPGGAYVFAIGVVPELVQRVVAELRVTHPSVGDLVGNLSHLDQFAVLNNHSRFSGSDEITYQVTYDDSNGGLFFGSRTTDGPGTLNNFVGTESRGLWLFTMSDDSLNWTGRVENLTLRVQPQLVLGGGSVLGSVLANQFVYYFVDVPVDATRLTVTLSSLDPALPLNLYLRRGQAPTTTEYDKAALINPPGGSLSLGLYDVPPLNAGRYFIGIFNPNAVTVSFRIRLDLERDLAAINGAGLLGGDTPLPLQDEAITRSSVYVATAQPVVDVQVGVRVQHARASDLLLYLVSPQGTRVLLAENRGRTNALGIGGNTDVVTNYTSVFSNSFERAVDGYYLEGETFDGWQVETNLASVLNDATLAHTGNKVLALRTARIARVLPTMAGRDYQLDYCYRLNPGRGCIISWWPGEEDAADRTGNNPGALENGLGFAPGWVGRAFSFDGTNDACRVPASTSLHVQSFTLEGWLQPADLSRPQPIGAYAATNDWLGLHCGINADATGTNVSPGALYVNVRAAGANPPAADHVLATRPGLLTTNAWYHVAWTFDQPSGLAQIYLNGTLAAATNLGSFSPRTGLPLYLGHRPPGSLDPDGGATYRGLLDEFSLYDCVLSAVEIEDVVLSGSGGKCANSRPAVTCSSTNVAVLGGSLTNLAIGELPWKTNSVQFRAPQDGTRLSLETDGYQPGMLLDTLQLFELETVSNPNFTTFTESTNLATFPIKFAPAPFTNSLVSTVQTNRLLLDDSFELYSTGSYPAGTNLAGWRVTSGEVVVHGHTNALSILPVSGSNFVELKVQADPAAFSTNVQTVANRQYRLTFLAHRNPTGPAGSPQAVALYTNGVISEWIDVPVSAWVTNTVTYRAASTSLELEFRSAGSTGPLLDLVQLLELADDRQYYFLPEETLQAFEGESPLGNWTLEVWDDRGGPDSSLEPALAAWQLNFIFAHTNPPATPLVFCRPDTNTASVYLQDCIPATNTVANDEIQYFYVEVPRSATLALNHLRSVDGTNDLVLLFSQNGLPTGRRASDVVVDQSTGPEEFLLLNTNDPPQLQPGQRYYLGVANAHPDETSHFLLSVTFDRRDTNLLSLLALTNGVPYTATIPVTNALQYYQFTVSSNATEVRFELFPQDGNVDLVVRKALAIPDPLPTTSPGRYDYISQNGGTNAELIAVTAASQPFALEPGVWYLGVFNVHTNPVTYAIRATELSGSPIQIVPLTDGVPLAGSLVVGSATTNYYLFSVNQSPGAALFELYDVTQPADLLLNLSAFPTPAVFFARDPAAPTRPGQIVLRTNVLFPSLNGDWYLAVGNPLTVDLTYTIRAALPTNGLLLSGQPLQVQAATLGGGGLELTWNTVEGEKYEVDSSTNLVTWLTITNFVATGKTLTFIDPSAGQLPALYYRVRQVP